MALTPNEIKMGVETFIKLILEESPAIQQSSIDQVRDALNQSNGKKLEEIRNQATIYEVLIK